MHQLVIAILAATAIAMVFISRGTVSADGRNPAPEAEKTVESRSAQGSTAEIKIKTREDLRGMLQKLSTSPAPKDLGMGATCYKPRMIERKTVDLVCPECKKSSKTDDGLAAFVRSARETVKYLSSKGFAVALDEKEYCGACGGGVKSPALYLIASPDGEKRVRTSINSEDLSVLRAFADGKDRIDRGPEGEKSLKDFEKRIDDLLGINQK